MTEQDGVYRRVLLKLSGEALSGRQGFGIDPQVLHRLAQEIGQVVARNIQVGLVIGGGNLFRGAALAAADLDRVTGDQMGMLATVMNALAMQNALERAGSTATVMSAISMDALCEVFNRDRAIRHLGAGRVVIFSAGTGNPFFTTDTAASLRAMEIGAEVILKASHHVDGVYDRDPLRESGAQRFDRLTYLEVLKRNLKVMDSTAISMCMDNRLPILVFNFRRGGNIKRAVIGEAVGTLVDSGP